MACATRTVGCLIILAAIFIDSAAAARSLLTVASTLAACSSASADVPIYSINDEYLWLSSPYGPYVNLSSLAECAGRCNSMIDCAGFVAVFPDGQVSCQPRKQIRPVGNVAGPGVTSYVRCTSAGVTYSPSSAPIASASPAPFLPPPPPPSPPAPYPPPPSPPPPSPPAPSPPPPPSSDFGPCPFFQSNFFCKSSCPSNDAVATGAIESWSSLHHGDILAAGAEWFPQRWDVVYNPGMQVGIGDCCALCEAGNCDSVPNCEYWKWVQTDPNNNTIGACTLYGEGTCGNRYEGGNVNVTMFYKGNLPNYYSFGYCGDGNDWDQTGPNGIY